MDINVTTLDGKAGESVALPEDIFGLEPRADILQRMVRYQLAKRRAGTHKTKTRGEVSGSTAKIYKQKGTGRARHGSKRANIFRTGGRAFGPTPRDHSTDLTKKLRKLGLRCALSAKAGAGQLIVLDEAALTEPKTRLMGGVLDKLGLGSALFVVAGEPERNFALASRNLPTIDLLPQEGANVYDILRRDVLVLTRDAAKLLEERLA